MSSTKDNIFRFKQFSVDQTGCAMKVNTDGVLLGVLCKCEAPHRILDVGTGTGVVSLILAQRFSSANITAVEIDEAAALTAKNNFEQSAFHSRLKVVHGPVVSFYESYSHGKFDLIVSNPPFFINSLRSDNELKGIARHTDEMFFETLLRDSAEHLHPDGKLVLIVPVTISGLLQISAHKFGLSLQRSIGVCSFPDSLPHREILTLGLNATKEDFSRFIIYDRPKEYSTEYRAALKDFFTIF